MHPKSWTQPLVFLGGEKSHRKKQRYTEFNVCNQKVYLSPVLDLFNSEILSYDGNYKKLDSRTIAKKSSAVTQKYFAAGDYYLKLETTSARGGYSIDYIGLHG